VKKFNPGEAVTGPTVFFIFKKSCPACGPLRALIEANSVNCSELQFIEVEAVGDNLDFCFDHGVDKTPAVVIFTDDYRGPYDDSVLVVEHMGEANRECKKEK